VPRGGPRGPKPKTRARAGKTPLHQQLLDQVLEAFAPEVPAIARKIAKVASAEKGGEGLGKFVIEYVAKYSDRVDENEAAEELRKMTRMIATGADYMSPEMAEEIKQSAGEPVAERVLESEEDRRVVESDVAAAPRSLVPPEDPTGEGL